MIPSASLDFLIDPESQDEADPAPGASGETSAGPQVFIRTLSAPPGWPWEQRRNADLEARHGAPLPLSELLYRIRRLEPWRPGAAARFAAFYVLAREMGDELEAHADVDGRQVAVTFSRALRPTVRSGRLAGQAVIIAALLALVAGAIGGALTKRAETAAALETAEQRAAVKYRQLRVRERMREEQRLLADQLDRGAPLRDVASDLAWASAAKSADAHIEVLHWQGGVMTLEVKGDRPPFEPDGDRRVERSKRPVRNGVWVWGVGPARAASAASQQASAQQGPRS